MAVLDGTPILCHQCGGGMSLQRDLSVVCRYCHARDVLPADELARALDIENRLAIAEQRAAQVRGVDAALASVFEDPKAFWRVCGLYFVFALFLLVYVSWQLASTLGPRLDTLSHALLIPIIVGQATGPLSILLISISLAIALARGRAHYRRHVRPLLLARPSDGHGAGFLCRACGGTLPVTRTVEVRCPYCSTANLMPAELHGARAANLFREAQAATQNLHRAKVATISIARTMRRTLIVCGVGTAVIAYGLPMLAQSIAGRV
jgi:DNA-directed RNA polymerase subunit RPC12/RpoP